MGINFKLFNCMEGFLFLTEDQSYSEIWLFKEIDQIWAI